MSTVLEKVNKGINRNPLHQNLLKFVSFWDNLTKNTETLRDRLFELSFRNLVSALTDRLTDPQKNKLLSDHQLNQYLRQKEWEKLPEVRILEEYLGNINFSYLNGVKKKKLKNQFKRFNELLAAPDFISFLEHKICEEINRHEKASRKVLCELAKLLLYETIFYHSPHTIRFIPAREFSTTYALICLSPKIKDLESNTECLSLWRSICHKVFSNINMRDDTLKVVSLDKNNPFEFSSKFRWEIFMNNALQEIINILSVVRSKYKIFEPETNVILDHKIIQKIISELSKQTELVRNFEEKVLEAFLCEILSQKFQQGKKNTDFGIGNFIEQLADLIDNEGEFIIHSLGNRLPGNKPGKENRFLTEKLADLTESLSISIMARKITKSLFVEELQTQTIHFLQSLLIEISELGNKSFSYFLKKDASECFFSFLNNKKILEIFAKYLKHIANYHFPRTVDISNLDMDLNDGWIEFSKKVIGQLSEWFGVGYRVNLSSRLPWHKLNQHHSNELIKSLLSALIPPSRSWEVDFAVKNMIPQASAWKVGKVDFFDPNEWYYGLDGLLPRNFISSNQKICGARVFIDERTSYAVIQKSRELLRETLDFLTFFHSSMQKFGFHATIHHGEILRIRCNFLRRRGFKRPEIDFAIRGTEKDEYILESSKYIDVLLSTYADYTKELTDLQNAYRLSVSWYRRGRWGESGPDKFISYWIALEHLFGEQFVECYKKLPLLYITWRNIAGYHIRMKLQQIVKFMEEDKDFMHNVSNDPELNGWQEYWYILQENLPKLEKYATKQRDKEYIHKFILDFPPSRVEAIKETVALQRIEFKFTLLMLYSLRNTIVHQALSNIRYLPLYIEELGAILEFCLRAISQVVFKIPATIKNIDEFIKLYQKPYSVLVPDSSTF